MFANEMLGFWEYTMGFGGVGFRNAFVNAMQSTSEYAIPVIILLITTYGILKGVKVYEVFTEGAKEGFYTGVRIIPFLVAMLVAIGVFRASGAMKYLSDILAPVTGLIGMPSEVLPMAIMRPLSGGGANGVMNDLFTRFGPDSLIGRMASVMAGSTDTTFYILAVYFGAISIRKTRYALPCGLLADVAGLLAAVIVTNMVFG